MRKIIALASATAVLWCVAPARAGVVITQKQTLQHGTMSRTTQQTVTVQGNKQKIDDGQRVVIVDLDQMKQIMLTTPTKTYFELPIKASRKPHMMSWRRGSMAGFDFKKTGKSRTVNGYKCDDYEASGQSMAAEYTTTQCFSKSAPGAAEFAAFQRAALDKMTANAGDKKVTVPDGIPVASDSTIQMGHRGMQRQGEQSFGGGHHTQERPATVIHTEVTKIVKQDLPASAFAAPPDYKPVKIGAPPTGAEESPGAAPSAGAKESDE
jgi:hypothetical protein